MKVEDILKLSGLTKPIDPDMLSEYHIDIEQENEDDSWYGKVWKDTGGTSAPFLSVSNAGDGSQNIYRLITSVEMRNEFVNACNHCFPHAMHPVDTACVYLELRQAQEDGWSLSDWELTECDSCGAIGSWVTDENLCGECE